MGSNFVLSVLRASLGLAAIVVIVGPSYADEIVIDHKVNSKVSIGDFACSKCPAEISNALMISADDQTQRLTAGRLWRFFDSQGVDSVETITICLDIEPSENSGFGLQAFGLKIENPGDHRGYITDVSFGGSSIRVPDYEITYFKPEAKLEISLGYDFMQHFSGESGEEISLDFSSDSTSAFHPVFSIEGKPRGFTTIESLVALAGFVGFWIVVFFALNWLTRRAIEPTPVSPVELNPNNATRALSV